MQALLSDIHLRYKADSRHLAWNVPDFLTSSPEVAYRNGFAERLAQLTPEQIVSSYVYMSFRQMEDLLQVGLRFLPAGILSGCGLELGAGCGLLSATIAKLCPVDAVLALEVCDRMASLVIPKVAAGVLGNKANKVVPVFGSFDAIELPDSSLDFIVEIDSLHHSPDLGRTLAESARVLKPGGTMLCFDRAHPNSLTDAEIERMLSAVYTREFLVANCYPADVILTRRDNGEHEYRLSEWTRSFTVSGLTVQRVVPLQMRATLRRGIKGLLSLLPVTLRRRIYSTENASPRATLDWFRQRSGGAVLGPKNATLFVVAKP